jgi:hypothetical protein
MKQQRFHAPSVRGADDCSVDEFDEIKRRVRRDAGGGAGVWEGRRRRRAR